MKKNKKNKKTKKNKNKSSSNNIIITTSSPSPCGFIHARKNQAPALPANMKLGPGGPGEGTISSQTNGSKRTEEWTLKDDDMLGIFEIPTG